MDIKNEIIDLGKKTKIKSKAYQKSRDHLVSTQKFFSIAVAVLTAIQAVISTYDVFADKKYIFEYIDMILAIASAGVSAYVSFSEFPETIARYEVATTLYKHVSTFFADLYNGLSRRAPEATQLGVSYCKATINILDGLNGDIEVRFSEDNDHLFQKFHREISGFCEGDFQYLELYKYTYDAFSQGQFFHILEGPQFCSNHVQFNDYAFSPHFLEHAEDGPLFKSWILSNGEKTFIICEKSGPLILAVVVQKKDWESAKIYEANADIEAFENILDSDLFNPGFFLTPEAEIIVEV